MLQQYYIFVSVMAGTKLYRQICAALLLLVLLFTTAVQLTHTHAVKQTAEARVKKSSPQLYEHNFTPPGADTKCFIHEYQLTKDADCSISIFQPVCTSFSIVNSTSLHTQLTTAHCSNFESRGPPAGCFNA